MTAIQVAKLSNEEISTKIHDIEWQAVNGSTEAIRKMAKTQANWLRERLLERRPK